MFKFKHYLLSIALLSAIAVPIKTFADDSVATSSILEQRRVDALKKQLAEANLERGKEIRKMITNLLIADQERKKIAYLDGKELRELEKKKAEKITKAKYEEEELRDRKELDYKSNKPTPTDPGTTKQSNKTTFTSSTVNLTNAEKEYLKREQEHEDSLAWADVDYQLEKIAIERKKDYEAQLSFGNPDYLIVKNKLTKEAIDRLAELHRKRETIEEQIIKTAMNKYNNENLDGKELVAQAELIAKVLEVGPKLAGQDFKAANFPNAFQERLAKLHEKKEAIEEEIQMALTKYKKGNLDGKELRAEAEKAYKAEQEEKAFLSEVDDRMEEQADEIAKADADQDCIGDCKEEKVDKRISALEGSITSLTKKFDRFFTRKKKAKEEKEKESGNYLAGIEKFMAPILEKIMTPISQGLAAMIETQKQMSVTLAGIASNMQNNSQMNNGLFQGLVLGAMLKGDYNPQGATFNPFNPFSQHYNAEESWMNKYVGGNNFFRGNRPNVGFNFGTVNQWGGNGTVNQS